MEFTAKMHSAWIRPVEQILLSAREKDWRVICFKGLDDQLAIRAVFVMGAETSARSGVPTLLIDLSEPAVERLEACAGRFVEHFVCAGERRQRTRLSVSLLPSLAAAWLVPRLPALRVDLPGIELHVRAERLLVDFSREDVDVAIRFGAGPFRDLLAHRFGFDVQPFGHRVGKLDRAEVGAPAPCVF